MSISVMDEQIRLYARQLKIPGFANYEEVLRQAEPSLGFSGLLLELMRAECEARQENQSRRRLKAAGFPFQKTLDEFDFSQLNPSVSPEYIKELASCQFVKDKRNIIMMAIRGGEKPICLLLLA